MLSSPDSRLTNESKVFEPLTNENPGVRLHHPHAGDDEPDLQVIGLWRDLYTSSNAADFVYSNQLH